MGYMDSFREHYKDVFGGMSASGLVIHEERLSRLLDNDEFSHVILIDEAIALYEIVRDECVKRVAILASSEE